VLARFPFFDFDKRRGVEMFEAFHQSKKVAFIQAHAANPKMPIDYESLAGQNKRAKQHVENAKRLYEERNKK